MLAATDTAAWRTALAVMQALGVPNPHELAAGDATLLSIRWLLPTQLAKLLALQRCMPHLAAGEVFELYAKYAGRTSAEQLAGRLLYLQRHGLLGAVVRDKRQPGRSGDASLISVTNVAQMSDKQFAAWLAARQPDGSLEQLQAFMRGLHEEPAWLQLLAEAAAEAARLGALLPQALQSYAAVAAADGAAGSAVGDRRKALEEEFGAEAVKRMAGKEPKLLDARPEVWQTALAFLRRQGLQPHRQLAKSPRLARLNPLHPAQLANVLALQRALPQLPAAEVVDRFCIYAATFGPERVLGRMLYLAQHVPAVPIVPTRLGTRDRSAVSISDVCSATDERFSALPAVQQAGGSLQQLHAFTRGLPTSPAFWHRLAEAAEEAERLADQLPSRQLQAYAQVELLDVTAAINWQLSRCQQGGSLVGSRGRGGATV